MKWKHFPYYWPFLKEIHRWPVDSPHKDRWRRTLMISLTSAWTTEKTFETPKIFETPSHSLRRHCNVISACSSCLLRYKWKCFTIFGTGQVQQKQSLIFITGFEHICFQMTRHICFIFLQNDLVTCVDLSTCIDVQFKRTGATFYHILMFPHTNCTAPGRRKK